MAMRFKHKVVVVILGEVWTDTKNVVLSVICIKTLFLLDFRLCNNCNYPSWE